VEDVVALDERRHREEMAELLPEGQAAFRIIDRELDVGDAIDLDAHGLLHAPTLPAPRVGSTAPGIPARRFPLKAPSESVPGRRRARGPWRAREDPRRPTS